MARVLIADDDLVQLRLTAEVAAAAGFQVITVSGGQQTLEKLRSDPGIGVLVLDLVMPDLDGMGVMDMMRRDGISTPVIIVNGSPSLESVEAAMSQGAADYIAKPVAPERMVLSLRNALRQRELEALVGFDRQRYDGRLAPSNLVTRSPAMERVAALAAKAAKSSIPVLIEGEKGSGKELVARSIHGSSDRAGRPFVVVNCGSILPAHIDSVLFGHRKGAFAGALSDHSGKFLDANGGTILLNEVGKLPLAVQAKVSRFLEDGEVEVAGAGRPARVNARVIATTSRRLLNLTRSGEFREDLFYRLNVLPVYVPPLRDRPEDMAALAQTFLISMVSEAGKRVVGISDEAAALLRSYSWPGNVQQLENTLYRAVALCEGAQLAVCDFPHLVATTQGRAAAIKLADGAPTSSAPVHIDDFRLATDRESTSPAATDRFVAGDGEVAALADVERDLIVFALTHYGRRMSRVARALGIGRSTLYRKLREYGLESELEAGTA